MITFKKLLIAILFLTAIIIGAFYWQTSKERERTKISERKIQQAKELGESKKNYNNALAELCLKPLTEASALELYICKNLKSSEGLIELGISPESATSSAHLPTFCNRKIMEMKMLELLECLDYTDASVVPDLRTDP